MQRVIFDRSAFHGNHFERLRASSVGDVVRAGKLQIHHTTSFLEETLRARRSNAPWKEHLQFVLELDNRFIYREVNDIWHQELVQGRGPFAKYYLPDKQTRSTPHTRSWIVRRLRGVLDDAEADALWDGIEPELEAIRMKKLRYRRQSVEIRKEVARRASAVRAGVPGDKPRIFREFLGLSRLSIVRALMPLVSGKRHDALTSQWALNPARYPFFTAFINSFMYMDFYAAVEQGRPLDYNDQVDYQLLVFLHAADIVVSNDTGFPQDCFSMLWAPKGKRYLSSDEFIELVERLA